MSRQKKEQKSKGSTPEKLCMKPTKKSNNIT